MQMQAESVAIVAAILLLANFIDATEWQLFVFAAFFVIVFILVAFRLFRLWQAKRASAAAVATGVSPVATRNDAVQAFHTLHATSILSDSPYAWMPMQEIPLNEKQRIDQQRFWEWLGMHNIEGLQNLYIGYFAHPLYDNDANNEGGNSTGETPERLPSWIRGVCARKPIASEDLIVSVPEELWLCKTTAVHSPIGHVFQAHPDLDQRAVLEIFLLHEKNNPQSPWVPWLNMLPTNADTLVNWDQEALAALQGSPMLARRQHRIESVVDRFRTVIEPVIKHYPDLFPTQDADTDLLQDYMWTFTMVMSRAVSITVDSEPMSAIVPLVDMFNHAPCCSKSYQRQDGTQFAVDTGTSVSYEAGEQIFVDVGPLSNADLIDRYGFALQHNVRDFVEFSFRVQDVAHPSLITELKSNVVLKNMLVAEDGNSQVHTLSGYYIPPQLLISLRILLITPNEMNRMHLALEGKPVSWRNEVAVANVLFNKCTELLKAYPTTVKEDRALLKKPLPHNVRHAILYRTEQKRILRNTLKVLRYLQLTVEDRRRSVSDDAALDVVPDVDLRTLEYTVDKALLRSATSSESAPSSSSSSSSSSSEETDDQQVMYTAVHVLFERNFRLVSRLQSEQGLAALQASFAEMCGAEAVSSTTLDQVVGAIKRQAWATWDSQIYSLVLLCAKHGLLQQLETLKQLNARYAGVLKGIRRSAVYMNTHDLRGRTPLFLAASAGDARMLVYLLDSGADLKCVDHDGLNVVHIACVKGHTTILNTVLDLTHNDPKLNGWLLTKRSLSEGFTPLHFAVMNGHVDVARALLEDHQADVNATADDNITALHACAFTGNVDMCMLLLENGADTSATTLEMKLTPKGTAEMMGHTELLRLLEE